MRRNAPVDPRLWRASAAVRRFLGATVCCGVVISACAIASAVVLARIVAGLITDPSTRTLGHWTSWLLILLALWIVRAAAQWRQVRLSQRGASAVIADLGGQVLRSVTAADPETWRSDATTPPSWSCAGSTGCGRISRPTCLPCSWPRY
jgi:ATP-binding cassette subfamily C protein CydD